VLERGTRKNARFLGLNLHAIGRWRRSRSSEVTADRDRSPYVGLDGSESEERLAAAARGANLGLWDVEPRSGEVLINAIFESQRRAR